ncbi:MAG: plastocyanin/azurin family copper-binding protein [Xanthomonadales bacterium]|jgi:pseudoazurin|nr:plastocyanin/azurin family copper-binding protein [Xanthomonadales bacterium]
MKRSIPRSYRQRIPSAGIPILIPVLACALVLAGLLPPSPAAASEHEIHGIDNRDYEFMFFEPDFLQVEPGDRVTFVVHHFDHKPRSVFVPAGAEPWEAAQGQSITVSLETEGVYLFDCFYHNVQGMAGVLVVGDPVNLEEARAFFARYREDIFAMNADRLDPIWAPDDGKLAQLARERGETPNQ